MTQLLFSVPAGRGAFTCSHPREQVHGNGGEWACKMRFTGSKIGLKQFAQEAVQTLNGEDN